MSKRVANCKGRKTARFGRIRYGWKIRRQLNALERAEEQLELKDLDEKLRTHYENAKQKLKSVLPKRLLRRSQAR